MSLTKQFKGLTALDLKLMAMAFMLCDHVWATIVPGAAWLNAVGRLAFPIFAFQIAEGYARTHSYRRYLGRMFLFALISEIPYDLMMAGDGAFKNIFRQLGRIFTGEFDVMHLLRPVTGLLLHQNVMFTFFLGLLMLRLLDWARGKNFWFYLAMIPAALSLGYTLGTVTFVDYHGYGVLMVMLFYLTREVKLGWLIQIVGMWIINVNMIGGMTIPVSLFGTEFQLVQQGFALLALIPIWLYHGRQGPHSKVIQYACYAFYPVHILILSLLALYGF